VLREMVNAKHVEILLGSGSLANDVIGGQLALEQQPGLILSSGEFGERLTDHAARFGMDFDNATAVSGSEIFRDDPRLKRYGLADNPMSYAPAVTLESPLAFVQQDKAEASDLVKCWRQKEPARKLVAVGDRPILYLAAEASFYAPYNHCTVGYLKQAGVEVSFSTITRIE